MPPRRTPPPSPARPLAAEWFLVEILTVVSATEYTFAELWLQSDGTYAIKAAGRYGGADNVGVALIGTFAVGDFALCRSAAGAGGLTWELVPLAATSGASDCTGCGWTVAYRAGIDCTEVYVDGALQDDPETVTIDETDYAVAFDPDGPSLTLTPTGGSGGPVTGTLDCCVCPCATFAFKRSDFFLVGSTPASVCDRLLKVRFCQTCCPIEGWDGAGWYCVREAGSGGPCEALELLEVDKCDGSIEICSGPYESEAAAEEACGPTAVTFGTTCGTGGVVGQDTLYGGAAGGSGPSTRYLRADTLVIGFTYRVHYTRAPSGNAVTVSGALETGGGFPLGPVALGASGCFEIDLGPTPGGAAGYYCLQFDSDGAGGADDYTISVVSGAC